MAPNFRVAIVGGGLAGLATAQALKSFGVRAEVFEAAPALGEIGAAVNTSPQAVKAPGRSASATESLLSGTRRQASTRETC